MSEAVRQPLKQSVKAGSAQLVRQIAGIPWLRYVAVRVLNRIPFVKHRLQRLLATVPQNEELFTREAGNEQDYIDILPYQATPFKLASLLRKDSTRTQPQGRPQAAPENIVESLCVTGHFDGSYSLASVNRQLVQRLWQDRPELECVIEPYEGAPAHQVNDAPEGESVRQALNEHLLSVRQNKAPVDVRIFHHYPLIKPVSGAQKTAIALFFWEESLVKEELICQLNQWYDAVIVTAWSVKKALIDSGCSLPIEVVAFPLARPIAPNSIRASRVLIDATAEEYQPLVLLHVSSCFPRKGVDILLEAFDRVACDCPGLIQLIIKTFPNPHNQIDAWLEALVRPELRQYVQVINEDYTAEQMSELYQCSDVVVLPSRGEGLNLPAIEAGLFERHIITTGYGAQTDFVPESDLTRLSYRFAKSQSHVAQQDSLWVDPSVDDLVHKLTTLVMRDQDMVDAIDLQIEQYKTTVEQLFFTPAATQSFLASITAVHDTRKDRKDTQALALEMITTWGEDCGIAEYSKSIIQQLLADADQNERAQIRIRAPHKRYQIQQSIDRSLQIDESWWVGSEPDLNQVSTDTDLVWLQHHFAFYALGATLKQGAEQLQRQGVLTAITLHTSKPLLGFDTSHQMLAIDCLRQFGHVFVHTLDDINNLKRLGLVDNVTLMPHGIQAAEHTFTTDSSQQNTAAQESAQKAFTVGSFGFLLPHKGIDVLIEAFAQALRNESISADSRLRLVNTVRADGVSNYEKQRCQKIAHKLGIEQKIDWYSDFTPTEEVENLLRTCDLVVLPYQHTLESSSGAVRNAVAACEHVATTPAPIFDEVRQITHGISGYQAQDVCACIEHFYQKRHSGLFDELLERRGEWLAQHTWPAMVQRYQGIFNSRITQR